MPTPVLGANAAGASGWLEAGETWTYVSADSPTFVFSVAADVTLKYSAGMRVQLTQTTVKYFIITAVGAFSAGATQITVYGGTDYTLANAAITAPYYSVVKAPFGFPLDPAKWTVQVSDSSQRSQSSPTQNVWYNLGTVSINIPIGVWLVDYHVVADSRLAAGSAAYTTLSTANNSESDVEFTTYIFVTATIQMGPHSRQKTLTLAAKTTYYLNTKTSESSVTLLLNRNENAPAIIRAICAYL